jgi:hypothetical protein
MSVQRTTGAGNEGEARGDEAVARDARAFAERVEAACTRLAPRLPGLDPGDLVLIVQSVLRPIGTGRRFFLRPLSPGSRARVF